MKLVQPIRNKDLITQFGEELKEMNDKYYVMFRIGVTSGLRISDILNIKVADVKSNYINIVETKTKKSRLENCILNILTNANENSSFHI